MTREKLENLLYRFQVDSFNNKVSQFEYEDIAREILKSFESRTCENCKRWVYEGDEPNLKRICLYLDMDIDYELDSDFGCVKFERK